MGGNVGNKKKLDHHTIPITKQTIIGNDVWVGARATILAGVNIGTGAVVGTGSVVTHDIPPYAIVAGVPAKLIKFRFSEEIRTMLVNSRWWELPEEIIKNASSEIKDPIMFLRKVQELQRKD